MVFFKSQNIKKNDLLHFLKNQNQLQIPREQYWASFINHYQLKKVLEIGVFKGDFSAYILKNCSSILKYYMIDSWRHLPNWNKPCNIDNTSFRTIFSEMKRKTEFAKHKRIVLEGTTVEKIDQIKDGSLDFIYIDGDHTLKGISIDLIRSWAKIKPNGFIAGDDFSPNIWQHSDDFEPSLVFPYAVYFAEAVGGEIYGLPKNQFLIHKSSNSFKFYNFTNSYSELDLLSQLKKSK